MEVALLSFALYIGKMEFALLSASRVLRSGDK